jgi:hypothetical protein
MALRMTRIGIASLGLLALVGVAGCGNDGKGAVSSASASDSATTSESSPSAASSSQAPAKDSTEAAIGRFEDFLHAMGDEDIDTVCEIAGPAAKKAEDDGFGPCESTYPMVFEMISPEQSTALKSATVDESEIDDSVAGTVQFPVECVKSDATFTEQDLGDYTMTFQDGDWFITD